MRALLAASLLAVGCGGGPSEPVSLVDHLQWQEVGSEEDPFGDRPATVTCDEGAYYELLNAEETFSVDTELCDYVTVVQPSLTDVHEGDELHIRLWHFELTAEEPAEAHAAVRFGDTDVFSQRFPIPGTSQLTSPTWEASADWPAGTPVYFHLHNHGSNSWSFIELSVMAR